MKRDVAVGAVVYRIENNKIKYLLLHYKYKSDFWGPPKGKAEKGETGEETARREIKEETGIWRLKFDPKFKHTVKYRYNNKVKGKKPEMIFKIAQYFAARTTQKKVKLSWEHKDYAWLDYKTAIPLLKFKNAKTMFKKANEHINRSEKKRKIK